MSKQVESHAEGTPAGGPCDAVHFARKASKAARRKLGHSDPGFMGIYGLFAVAAVVATLVWHVSRWFGVGNALAVGVFAVLAAAVLLWTLVAAYRRRRAAARAQNALTDDTQRLNCVGHQQQILQHGRLHDVPFEPAVFSATFSYKWSLSMFLTFLLLLPPAAAAFFVGMPFVRSALALYVMMTVGVAALAAGCLWPTYFRVVPGRLDILRYNAITGKAALVEHFDLRVARILVDLRSLGVLLEQNDRVTRCETRAMRERNRQRFGYYLFLAALSTHESPKLPDDSLLG